MAIPVSYLTTSKNLGAILSAIPTAKAPERFTVKFLEQLGFKSSSDRQIIGVLKGLGFLDGDGRPLDRYYKFLDQAEAPAVLAAGIEDAYSDLYAVNTKAHELTRKEVIGKLKTLTEGKVSDSVLDKHALTLNALSSFADFDGSDRVSITAPQDQYDDSTDTLHEPPTQPPQKQNRSPSFGGLHYNIQIILPDSRDTKVYDAIFDSMRRHLV